MESTVAVLLCHGGRGRSSIDKHVSTVFNSTGRGRSGAGGPSSRGVGASVFAAVCESVWVVEGWVPS